MAKRFIEEFEKAGVLEIINTKYFKKIEEIGATEEFAVFTKEGEKLIGIVLDPKGLGSINMQVLPIIDEKGIWLRRKNTVSFLGDHNIKSVRKAKPLEKEIDNK